MEIIRIYPPCWFANMDNPKLQLVIQGDDLANARVTIDGEVELEHEIICHTYNYIVLNVNTGGVKSNTSYKLLLRDIQLIPTLHPFETAKNRILFR